MTSRFRGSADTDIRSDGMKPHPFEGEGLTHEQTLRFWDNYAEKYSGFQQGDIPDQIIDRLFDIGLLETGCSVLELGSGPGTYSLRMAPRIGSLSCLDASANMLRRLKGYADERGLTNIEYLNMDWNGFSSTRSHDVAIATLCPGAGTPKALGLMERAARRGCVLVSWIVNHGDDLNEMVWKGLGKDYGYDMRNSSPGEEWLRENGRDPVTETFEARIVADIPLEELVAKERKAFETYGYGEEAERIARDILEPVSENGLVRYDEMNRMRMVRWTPPS